MGNPFAMTALRRSSAPDRFWMLRSVSRVFVGGVLKLGGPGYGGEGSGCEGASVGL